MQISRESFQRLDRNQDKQLMRQEVLKVDTDGDGQISQTEALQAEIVLDDLPALNKALEKTTGMDPAEVLFTLNPPSKKGMQSIPVVQRIEHPDTVSDAPSSFSNHIIHPLPNLQHSGPIMVEINNPEITPAEGRLFSSQSLDTPVRFGVIDGERDNRSFNMYAYNNMRDLNVSTHGRETSFRAAGKPVYQAMLVQNPGPEPMKIRVQGSGYANNAQIVGAKLNPAFQDFNADMKTSSGHLHGGRGADALLSQDLLREDYNVNTEETIPPGQALVVYTRVNPKDGDVRSGYAFTVLEPPSGQELNVEALLAQSIGGQKPEQANGHFILDAKGYQQVLQTPLLDGGDSLKQGENIAEALDSSNRRVTDMNGDGQVDIKDLKAFNNDLKKDGKWNDAIALGRINGVKAHSKITSEIPLQQLKDGQELNLNFAVNTKISDTAGSGQDQSIQMLSVSQLPKHGQMVPANLDRIAHGNYNIGYEIASQLSNTGETERTVTIALGSPSETIPEEGQQLPDYEYQELTPEELKKGVLPKSFIGENTTRFTGPAQVIVSYPDGQTQTFEAALVHKHMQAPQAIAQIQLKPGQTLDIQVRFMVPTNSTGPQILNIQSN